MGGIETDGRTASSLRGLYAVGECASVGIHGANRLGSNSLAELCVFGKVAGNEASEFAAAATTSTQGVLEAQAEEACDNALRLIRDEKGDQRIGVLRSKMASAMEDGCGIYRTAGEMETGCRKIDELKERYERAHIDDRSRAWNTEWLLGIELGFQLDVAQAMVYSAINRKESRGSHQRIDGYEERDDENFLKHTLSCHRPAAPPEIRWGDVTITRSPPGTRAYGAAGEQAEKENAQRTDNG